MLNSPPFLKYLFIYLFIYFWLHWALIAAHGLSLAMVSGGYSSLQCARASYCGGLSRCGARALGARASVDVAHGLSSCGTRAQSLCGMWDLPGPGFEPMSPTLAGRFPTTAPPGKSPPPYLLQLATSRERSTFLTGTIKEKPYFRMATTIFIQLERLTSFITEA